MKKLWFTLLLSATVVAAQAQLIIYNGSFDSVHIVPNGTTQPAWWTVMGDQGGESTTDSHAGPYAVRIYNFNNSIAGVLLYGSDDPPHVPGMPMLADPVAIHGFYKYIIGNNNLPTDSARGWVRVTRFNQLDGGTDTLGTGFTWFTAVEAYTPFTMTINYQTGALPVDSIHMRFESSKSCYCTDSLGTCCFLYLDEIVVELPSGVRVPLGGAMPSLYYDPSTNALALSTAPANSWSVQVLDATGREVFRRDNATGFATALDRALPPGIYLYRIAVNGRLGSGKLAVH